MCGVARNTRSGGPYSPSHKNRHRSSPQRPWSRSVIRTVMKYIAKTFFFRNTYICTYEKKQPNRPSFAYGHSLPKLQAGVLWTSFVARRTASFVYMCVCLSYFCFWLFSRTEARLLMHFFLANCSFSLFPFFCRYVSYSILWYFSGYFLR